MEFLNRKHFETAANVVRDRTTHQPKIGLILGSGLSVLAESVEDANIIPYEEIPNWPSSTVKGHQGKLYMGQLEGHPVMVMRGRVHHYEGYSMGQVTFPIRIMQLMGIETLILTNAAGGIGKGLSVGDVMMIRDHISFSGMTGESPLRGPNDETLGPRFPNMGQIYDRALRKIALDVAENAEIDLKQGVYVGLSGPAFETPAEVHFLQMIGGDAVGMSTAPEATVAVHGGMRVLAFSGITNIHSGEKDSEVVTSHEEVLEAAPLIVPRMEAILRGVLKQLPTE